MELYKVFARFPKEEGFALTSQKRRASLSVPSKMKEKTLESLNP
ncbi:MAG: four helix bundle protein [Deltaproteobacteria bacterium]|nr:four helix bundle protein [Deltaproteobacteria bacterium]